MKRDIVRRLGGVLVVGIAVLALLPACAGPTGAADATAPATADAALSTNSQAAAAPADAAAGDLLASGKLIFDKTAGGVGCAACHALDGKGNGPVGVNAPAIRGKNEGDVRAAISGGVPMMTGVINLNDEEIAAVVAYLEYLNGQP